MDNPYQAPNSRVEDPASTEIVLASRATRLAAAILDGVIMAVIVVPLQMHTGYSAQVHEAFLGHQPLPIGLISLWALAQAAVYVVTQAYPLIKDGQTWGKKACSIKIVTMDNAKPSPGQLAIRCGVYTLIRAVPYVGPLVSIVNMCFIFRSDKRCMHDLAAGTHVVKA